MVSVELIWCRFCGKYYPPESYATHECMLEPVTKLTACRGCERLIDATRCQCGVRNVEHSVDETGHVFAPVGCTCRRGKPKLRGQGTPKQALLSYWAAELLRLRPFEEENERLRAEVAELREAAKIADARWKTVLATRDKNARLGANLRKLAERRLDLTLLDTSQRDWAMNLHLTPDTLDDAMEEAARDC